MAAKPSYRSDRRDPGSAGGTPALPAETTLCSAAPGSCRPAPATPRSPPQELAVDADERRRRAGAQRRARERLAAALELTAKAVNSRILVNSGARGADCEVRAAGGAIETQSDAESRAYDLYRRNTLGGLDRRWGRGSACGALRSACHHHPGGLRVAPQAEAQIREAARWWWENRLKAPEAQDEGAGRGPSRGAHLALRSKPGRRTSATIAAQQDVGRIRVGQAAPDDSPRSRDRQAQPDLQKATPG